MQKFQSQSGALNHTLREDVEQFAREHGLRVRQIVRTYANFLLNRH
ncbi:MAG: hypothetical protein LDL41_00815 [Coleofasciculus sp. S288]|nr:hypothetical protein [Coleofasciculus sp. S288]